MKKILLETNGVEWVVLILRDKLLADTGLLV